MMHTARPSRRLRNGAALLVALSAVTAALAPAVGRAQGPAPAASAATQDSVRPALAAPINAGLDLLSAGKFREALAKVAEAEALAPERTPYENFILDQLRGGAAAGAGEQEVALRSFEAALASGRLQGAQARAIIEGLVGTSYRLKDYARTVAFGRRYAQEGGSNPQVRRLVANALVQQADWAGASAAIQALLADDEAAGRRPAEDQLRLLASSQNKAGDQAGYQQTVERLLRHHPKPAYWRDRIAQLQSAPGFDAALQIDSYRLLAVVGGLEGTAEHATLAELALKAGLPGEAKVTLDAAAAAGKPGTSGGTDAALRDSATRQAAADAKTLDAAPAPSASGNALVGQGLALAGSGQAARGAALVEQGLAKGGVTRPDLARLRLGWAAVLAGRSDAARAAFSALQATPGSVGELARLWLIHLDRPAGA